MFCAISTISFLVRHVEVPINRTDLIRARELSLGASVQYNIVCSSEQYSRIRGSQCMEGPQCSPTMYVQILLPSTSGRTPHNDRVRRTVQGHESPHYGWSGGQSRVIRCVRGDRSDGYGRDGQR